MFLKNVNRKYNWRVRHFIGVWDTEMLWDAKIAFCIHIVSPCLEKPHTPAPQPACSILAPRPKHHDFAKFSNNSSMKKKILSYNMPTQHNKKILTLRFYYASKLIINELSGTIMMKNNVVD